MIPHRNKMVIEKHITQSNNSKEYWKSQKAKLNQKDSFLICYIVNLVTNIASWIPHKYTHSSYIVKYFTAILCERNL